MKFVGLVHRYMYHTLYEFGLFTFKSDGFIMVALNDLKPTQSRRHLHFSPCITTKIPYGIIFVQQRVAVCTRKRNGSPHQER